MIYIFYIFIIEFRNHYDHVISIFKFKNKIKLITQINLKKCIW